jgi:hypothetical protein
VVISATCIYPKITPLRIVILILLVGLFIFAKAWVFHHPKGMAAIVVGAIILVLSESAQAA